MANVIPNSFRGELFSGVHNFASGGNDFKIALYTGSISAVYTTASTTVSGTNEVSTGGGSNYTRQSLSSQAVASSTAVASVDFGDSTWSSATTCKPRCTGRSAHGRTTTLRSTLSTSPTSAGE